MSACRGAGRDGSCFGGMAVLMWELSASIAGVFFAKDLHGGGGVGAGWVDGCVNVFTWSFCFGRNGVVVFGDEGVFVANGLEENVDAICGFDVPEYFAVLEPSMCEDSVYSTEDVGQLAHGLECVARISAKLEA